LVRGIPKVNHGLLKEQTVNGTSSASITIGTVEWYAWLEHHRSFSFETAHSTFTARKEKRPGGWYWYAYRRKQGKLHTAYLGKSGELTLERLNTVASVLEGAEDRSEGASQRSQHASVEVSLQLDQTSIIPFPTVVTGAYALTEAEPIPKHNLPVQLTSLVGREPTIATATALLRHAEVRLLSMIGTGGIGKTRLALEVATQLLEDFPDGIFFVALAPLRDPNLLLARIAHTLGIEESTTEPIVDCLQEYLRHKRLLLVLDNFEHLVTAAPMMGDLLMACPKLKLLVTSREVLHLRAEQQFSIPPLALPDRKHFAHLESLIQYPALDLFIQRARTVKHDFHLNEANAQSLAEICTHLDGLPLAIELAAARIKFLSPEALLARLNHQLQVLTGGARDLPERQQTLRNTIQWSYELLSAQEQQLFRRLSVFVGGCTFEAIEAVSTALGDAREQVLDGVASLIDKSLLQHTQSGSGEPRLHMLETIREYGLEVLTTSGEVQATQQAHAEYYLKLAEEAEPHFGGVEEALWLDRLEREHGNLRATIQWALERGEAKEGMHYIEMALCLGVALRPFWRMAGYVSEGRDALKSGLARSEGVAPLLRAKALEAAGNLAWCQNDGAQIELLCRESLALFRALGNKVGMAFSLFWLEGAAEERGDMVQARMWMEEALALFQELGNKEYMAWSYVRLRDICKSQGNYTRAAALIEKARAYHREIGNTFGLIGSALSEAHILFLSGGDPARIRSLAEEGLAHARELGYTGLIVFSHNCLAEAALAEDDAARAQRSIQEELLIIERELGGKINERRDATWALIVLGKAAMMQGDYALAHSVYTEGLQLGFRLYLPFCLEGIADVATKRGEPRWAAQLLGTAEALRDVMGTPIPSVWRADYEHSVTAARIQLGEKVIAAWAEGRAMTPEQALAAQGSAAFSKHAPRSLQLADIAPRPSPQPLRLTRRERDILHLLTKGLTSRQIAEQLIVSLPTVNTHVRSIYNKLGVTSRSAATRYAVEHHLV
jgi:predicted ATPase/DNA-binding CsgD family transcriptional regulator